MQKNKSFIRFSYLVLGLIFIVILAGSVVRTTHSGMGCPDWPKCFGRFIPPLNAGQLPKDYEKYLSRQDIDHTFNAFHTWIEYINRLATVVLSLAIGILMIWSFLLYFNTGKRKIFWLSIWLFVMLLLEAVLGYIVVHTNLQVDTITLHLFPIFILAGIMIRMIHLSKDDHKIYDTSLQKLTIGALITSFLQIFIGTQVRTQVDHASKSFRYVQREMWLSKVNHLLPVHEMFAWVTALICVVVFWKSLSHPKLQSRAFILLVLVVGELAMGFTLVNLNFPAFAQPTHLLLGSGILMTLYSLALTLNAKRIK